MAKSKEEIIIEMKDWFNKTPKPKNKLYNELWIGVENRVVGMLKDKSVKEVLDWCRSNYSDSNMQGVVWLNNICKQVYAKLWSINKGA